MAHFAQLDENNIVVNVIEIAADRAVNEQAGIIFCKSLLGTESKWCQTSTKIRRQLAGIGFRYVPEKDIFIEPIPEDGFEYYLDQETYTWKSTNKPAIYIGFAPSSEQGIEKLLDNVSWSNDDNFIDLGSGDGRVVLAAARRGIHSCGVEANPLLFNKSVETAKQLQINANFIQSDIIDINLQDYKIIFMYTGQLICEAIYPQIKKLPPGHTIISGDYQFPNWQPIDMFEFDYQKFYVWKT